MDINTRKNRDYHFGCLGLCAEREGFEPPAPLSAPVFKTGVIDHSTISPCSQSAF